MREMRLGDIMHLEGHEGWNAYNPLRHPWEEFWFSYWQTLTREWGLR